MPYPTAKHLSSHHRTHLEPRVPLRLRLEHLGPPRVDERCLRCEDAREDLRAERHWRDGKVNDAEA